MRVSCRRFTLLGAVLALGWGERAVWAQHHRYLTVDLGCGTVVNAVNNAGDAVGSLGGTAVMWSRGQVIVLWADQAFNEATAINDLGEVAGYSAGCWNLCAASPVIWAGGIVSPLPTCMPRCVIPRDMNDSGLV